MRRDDITTPRRPPGFQALLSSGMFSGKYEYRLGDEWIEGSPVERDLVVNKI